jgi:hypothetical protein
MSELCCQASRLWYKTNEMCCYAGKSSEVSLVSCVVGRSCVAKLVGSVAILVTFVAGLERFVAKLLNCIASLKSNIARVAFLLANK